LKYHDKIIFFPLAIDIFFPCIRHKNGRGLFKIRHWPMADELLPGGTILGVAALLFAIIKLLLLKKQS
jgi:hypothetical protein